MNITAEKDFYVNSWRRVDSEDIHMERFTTHGSLVVLDGMGEAHVIPDGAHVLVVAVGGAAHDLCHTLLDDIGVGLIPYLVMFGHGETQRAARYFRTDGESESGEDEIPF